MDEQLKQYIRNQYQTGVSPEAIKSQLHDAGWQPDVTDQAVNTVLSELNPSVPANGPDKKHPPLSVQVFYALGFLLLLFGLGVSVIIFAFSNSVSNDSIFGNLKTTANAAAIVYAVIVISVFVVINFLRAGKKWALIVLSILYGLSTIGVVMDLFDSTQANALGGVIFYLVFLPFFIIFWTKDKDYFNK